MEIKWQYFFGGKSGKSFDRYYKAIINGIPCEKHSSNKGVLYSVGNIDKAKVKHKTEKELIESLPINL